MRILKLLYLALGAVLLAYIVAETDLREVVARIGEVGFGFLLLLAIYFAAFAIDSFTWLMTLTARPMDLVWAVRTWAVRMVGEAFNNVIPAGGFGGEPVKAMLLKRQYGVSYREGTASLILAKTINMISLCLFLVVGFGFVIASEAVSGSAKGLAAAGLAALTVGTFGMFAVQRFRISSLTGTWLSRIHFARRIDIILHHIHDMDERLVAFYTGHRGRLAWAVALAFVNWVLGAVEVYYAMSLLGHPVSWSDAWIIEAVAQMVRAGTFFIPASIGAQEGAFVVVSGMITGSPTLGFSVAVVRRLRELVWISLGFLLGAWYSARPGMLGESPPS